MSATTMLCLAFGAAPALGATHTKVKVNANPAVGQLSKLHQRANGLSGSPDNKVVEFAGDMSIGTHDDYVVIAKAEGVPLPSSPSSFDADIHATKNVKINVDGVIAKMTKQHCGFLKKYPNISLASGLAPIIKGLSKARNTALKAAGQKTIKLRLCLLGKASADEGQPPVLGPPGGVGGAGQAAPLATLPPSSVHSTFASVQGGIPAYSEAVTVEFQYGPTTAYGQTSEPEQIPATGLSAGIRGTLLGLAASTTYHYRLAVITSTGTLYANDETLVTMPPAPVFVGFGGDLLKVIHGHAQMLLGCSGELDDLCQGQVQLTATQTLRRHHRRVHRQVTIAAAAFSISVGHDEGLPFQRGHGTVTLALNRTGRLLLAKTGLLPTRATVTVQRGRTHTLTIKLRRSSQTQT